MIGLKNTDTEGNSADAETTDLPGSLSSIGRFAQLREIADLVEIPASPSANMINGTVVTTGGGMSA